MRSKPLLSHSPLWFPTVPAIIASVLLPAALAHAQSQEQAKQATPAPATFAEDIAQRRSSAANPVKPEPPLEVTALKVWGRTDRFVHFEKEVEMTRGNMRLTADKATYRFLEDEAEAEGQVSLTRNGDCYDGDRVVVRLERSTGFVENPVYRLVRNHAQGQAKRIDFLDEERSVVHQGTYSTCQGVSPDWYLKTETLKLDTGLDTGTATRSVLYFKDTPILAAPSISFPLSNARHSGFLPPVTGATSKGGVEFGLPYYWNIAPNRDVTLYPKIISRRGLQLGGEARYLGDAYRGETTLEGIFDDRQTHTNRYALTSLHEQNLMPDLKLSWNLNMASDDNYPTDFSNSITKTSVRLLPRDLQLSYGGSFWNASFQASGYQVLQDVNAPITRPYDRLPQLQLHAEQLDVGGFDMSVDTMLTRFWHPDLVRGDRAVVAANLSLPFVRSGYFIKPQVSVHATNYHLVNPSAGQDADAHRVVPIFSLDSGLVFERDTSLFGRDFTQTLEPRLYYVNIPYRDQSRLPNFDSAPADFNFAQIFTENRFVGQDRIGDANQVTTALVSRYLENDGSERLKLAVGQRFYFNHQRVTLDNVRNPSRSDLLLAATGRWSSTLSGDLAFQLSQSDRRAIQTSYSVHWQPEAKKVLNLGYRFQRDSLEQVDISGQWPLADRLYGVGRLNYSLMDKRIVDGIAGLEYKADCWSLRFVAQRFATSTTTSNTGFALQLELTGLARLGVGGNPLESLKRNIAGYQSVSER